MSTRTARSPTKQQRSRKRTNPVYPLSESLVKTVRWLVYTSCLLLVIRSASGDLTYARPDPNARGGIIGIVPTQYTLQSVIAIEPYDLKFYRAEIDPASGQFTFDGLVPGEYDLLIKTVGHVHEGITLDFDEPASTDPKQRQALCDQASRFFFRTEDFFNVKQIVRFDSSGNKAHLFVVQTRTKRVVDTGGRPINAHIRRFDFVEMVKSRRAWQVVKSRHLLRQEEEKTCASGRATRT